MISEAGARRLTRVPQLNIRACQEVAVDVQLQLSPLRFEHLSKLVAQAC